VYAVIYRYETNEKSVASIMQSVSSDFADRIPAQIGSLLYTAIDTGDGTATTIVLYSDKDAAERGMKVSTQVRDSLNATYGITEKERIQGEVLVSRAADEITERIDP
jgi:multidrug efflux pump subunit AcrB